MRVRDAAAVPYSLPLRRPWRSARGAFRVRRGWLIRLRGRDGRSGFGECAPLPEAGTETMAAARTALDRLLPRLRDADLAARADLLRGTPPAVRCAVETAALDLRAQARGVPVAACLADGHASSVAVNRVAMRPSPGDGVVKVKVGALPMADDLAWLAQVPRRVRLRLDANGAWSRADAARFLAAAADLPCAIESVEEPLRDPTVAALAALQVLVPFPLALDESLTRLDVEAVLAAGAVRRFVLKPMARGGPAACLALARRAAQHGVESVVTTAVDGAVGAWAAVHTAAAVDPGAVRAHGLATSAWLRTDLAAAPVPDAGRITLPTRSGLGFDHADRARLDLLFDAAA